MTWWFHPEALAEYRQAALRYQRVKPELEESCANANVTTGAGTWRSSPCGKVETNFAMTAQCDLPVLRAECGGDEVHSHFPLVGFVHQGQP